MTKKGGLSKRDLKKALLLSRYNDASAIPASGTTYKTYSDVMAANPI